MVLRSALSAEFGAPCDRDGGIWSRRLSLESYASAAAFIGLGLDAIELGLVASPPMPYIWAVLLLQEPREVNPASSFGTPKIGGVEVGRLILSVLLA